MPLGLLGGVANIYATDMANTSNAAINRAQLKAQQEENQKQRDYDWKKMESEQAWQEMMWQKEQAYNSPAAQKQRLKEGGINPFLGSDAIGSGSTTAPAAPSGGAPSVGSLPSPIPMQSPNLQGLNGLGQFYLQKEQVDANVANQQSQALSNYLDMALKFYQDGNKDAGDKILDLAFAQYGYMHADKSLVKEHMSNVVALQEVEKQSREFELGLRKKYGDEQANQLLSNMKAEYDKLVSEKNLNETIEKLRDSEIKLNEAKTDSERENAKRLQAEAQSALASAAASYASVVASKANARDANARASINEESKQYFVSQAKSTAYQMEMDTTDKEAIFESNEYGRAWLRGSKGKESRRKITIFDNDPGTYRVGQLTGAIGNLISGSVNASVK